ncbi:fibronectin type III domain-containing protein, partial [Methanomethylovorans sp.]|uniref:fibronectin type III domain-containing protein n=1 Tax=Methanomethylovorans sp. TaxID=2758717 RepID=UPI001BD6102B
MNKKISKTLFTLMLFLAFSLIIVVASAAPVNDFSNTTVTNTSVTFTWTAATEATNIIIEHSLTGANNWSTATTGTISIESVTATVTGLTAETGYDFRLVVTGGDNEGTSNSLENVITLTDLNQANLTTAKNTAAALTEGNYTASTWSDLTTALALAETTNAEVITKTTAINDAIAGLITVTADADLTT